jgi:hypothetical protein
LRHQVKPSSSSGVGSLSDTALSFPLVGSLCLQLFER